MASQPKITSFYRTTKPNNSAAASKQRKAAVQQEQPSTVSAEIKTTISIKQVLEATKDAVSQIQLPESVSTRSNDVKNLLKVPSVRATRRCKDVKSVESTSESAAVKSEEKEKQVEFKPAQVATPKQPSDNSSSTRKRKIECEEQAGLLSVKTPKQIEEKVESRTPTKVRKRLDMGSVSSTTKQIDDLKIKSGLSNSPSKSIQFLCLGTLSPRKQEFDSPSKHLNSPRLTPKHLTPKASERSTLKLSGTDFKSPVVRSLAAVLDKASPKKKMTSEEIKARLGSSKNLAELRAKLSKVTDCNEKVKEFYQKQVQLQKFSSLELNIDVPVSPRKLNQSPLKKNRPTDKQPAYQRFHALAQPPSPHLVLPFKYKVLTEIFRSLETVVTMLYNRKECIFFNKLKPAVQKMLQREFTVKHLAQIYHVFPSAYKVTYEKPMANLQSSPLKNRGLQLTIAPNLGYLTPEPDNEEESNEATRTQKTFQPLGPSTLIERRYVFHNRLIQIVKGHHKEFLTSYNPLMNVPDDKLTRWHQNFDVDAVDDIPITSLPQAPQIKTFVTAQDVLEQAHSLVKVNPRLEAALKERSLIAQLNSPDPVVPPHSSTPADKDSNKQAAPANVGLKGINQSLIDKIRAREASKASKQMTMNSEGIRREAMSKLLPELARIINSVYVTEKKSVMPLRPLVERVQYSHRGSISAPSVEEHIKLLSNVYPEWLTILNRASVDYVKLDRKIDSNIVYQKLEDNIKAM